MLFLRLFRVKSTVKLLNYNNFSGIASQEIVEKFRKMVPKHRENPVILKLESEEFKSIFTEELNTLVSLFDKYKYEIRVAGGAVRDLLMGKAPKDLDFATTATPDQMKEMFTTENVRMINTKGEKHGTITPRINDKENFEVTTLRIDVITDGRHAQVEYTTDWMLDANRRDLTINSMFLGLDGSVYDYFYGYNDLKNRKVAFVGDARRRIQEDYLRILRYFRFYGRISENANNHEEETLKAIRENAEGLKQIAGERIWTELKKILEGNFAGEILNKMLECGIALYIGLPKDCDPAELNRLWKEGSQLKLNPVTLLSTLIKTEDEAAHLNARIKPSAFDRDLLLFLVANRESKLHKDPLHPYKTLMITTKGNIKDIRLWIIELLKYINSPHLEEFTKWELPKFPVSGCVLKANGVEQGRLIGMVMNELKVIWSENDFRSTEEELVKEIPKILSMLNDRRKK